MTSFFNVDALGFNSITDISTLALSIVIGILVAQTALREDSRFKILVTMLSTVYISTFSDLISDYLLSNGSLLPNLIYVLRVTHHSTVLLSLFLFMVYLHEPLWIERKKRKMHNRSILGLIAICTIIEIIGIWNKKGFHIFEDGTVHDSMNYYSVIIILMFISIIVTLIRNKSHLIDQVFYSILGVNIISVLLIIVQTLYKQTYFTCLACFLPIINVVFMFHSNPYDVETGAVSERYFENELNEFIEKKDDFVLISCKFDNFTDEFKNSKNLRENFNKFFRHNNRRGVLYHFPNNRFILVLKEKKHYDSIETVDKMKSEFQNNHTNYGIDFKIVIMSAAPGLSTAKDYLDIIEFIEADMKNSELKDIQREDIIRYLDSNYILSQLEDIVTKKDMDDPRVLVYCQPVYNIASCQYDTAEALMRLELPKTGMVYPDQFIPIAEQNNMIHTLSMIILNKVCAAIRDFIEDDYYLKRISVNFSVLDIKYDSFYSEVKQIIDRNGIPYEKIAVEITESRSEADFNVMKVRVMQLQELGIKFYLDDFGTGYSNFERIMEIPFDIIKFDRSLLQEYKKNFDSSFMVSTFADMFNSLKYAVLFEGVEDDKDENICVGMKAKYLQGYKYSKPIPIARLRDFLGKVY